MGPLNTFSTLDLECEILALIAVSCPYVRSLIPCCSAWTSGLVSFSWWMSWLHMQNFFFFASRSNWNHCWTKSTSVIIFFFYPAVALAPLLPLIWFVSANGGKSRLLERPKIIKAGGERTSGRLTSACPQTLLLETKRNGSTRFWALAKGMKQDKLLNFSPHFF